MTQETYNAYYKCRLCGETFSYISTGRSIARKTAIEMTINGNKTSEASVNSLNEHFCKDGSIGMADFLGWKLKKDSSPNLITIGDANMIGELI